MSTRIKAAALQELRRKLGRAYSPSVSFREWTGKWWCPLFPSHAHTWWLMARICRWRHGR